MTANETPTPAQQLEPCPFCGSSDVHVGGMIPWVECADCGACGPVAQPLAENEIAERLWNTRTPNTRALAALEAVEWRPIETAPEGVPVLVFDRWHTPRYSIGGIYKFTYATHWMPLPAPPADAVEVSRG